MIVLFALLPMMLQLSAPCLAAPVKAANKAHTKGDLHLASDIFSHIGGVVRPRFQKLEGASKAAAISTIVLFAAISVGAFMIVLVRTLRRRYGKSSDVEVSSAMPQPTEHHPCTSETDNLEACEAATSTHQGSTSGRSKREDANDIERSTPSGRFERALRIFSDDSEEPEPPPPSQNRLRRLLVKMWRRSRRRETLAELPEAPAPWPMPPPAVLRELQSVAA